MVPLLPPSPPPLSHLLLPRRKPPSGLDPNPIRLPGNGRRVPRRRWIRHGYWVEPPHPRHQPVHQLPGSEAQQRPLLPPRRLLLQLPPRSSGQPLQPRMQRHHSMPQLVLSRISKCFWCIMLLLVFLFSLWAFYHICGGWVGGVGLLLYMEWEETGWWFYFVCLEKNLVGVCGIIIYMSLMCKTIFFNIGSYLLLCFWL